MLGRKVLPNGWRASQEISEDPDIPVHTHFSGGLRFGTSYESGIQEALYLHSLPKDRNCDVCLRTKTNKDPLQNARAKHQNHKQKSLVT